MKITDHAKKSIADIVAQVRDSGPEGVARAEALVDDIEKSYDQIVLRPEAGVKAASEFKKSRMVHLANFDRILMLFVVDDESEVVVIDLIYSWMS